MTVLKDITLEAKKLAAIFEATGAEVVEMDFLQISNLLLDLYGEDIRGRAFICARRSRRDHGWLRPA